MAVIIAMGNDKDLVVIDFRLFPRLEGRKDLGSEVPRLGSIEVLENMWQPFCIRLALIQEAVASARLQLCAVVIKSISFRAK